MILHVMHDVHKWALDYDMKWYNVHQWTLNYAM